MSNYILALGENGYLNTLDTREAINWDALHGVASASLKRIFTRGQRGYYRGTNAVPVDINETRVYTYNRKDCVIASQGAGDYIPPGFLGSTRSLSSILSGYEGRAATCKAKLVPVPGSRVVNGNLVSPRSNCTLYRREPNHNVLPGWILVHSMESAYGITVDLRPEVTARGDNSLVSISQEIQGEWLEGLTSLRLRIEGSPTMVMVGTTTLTADENGVYEYTGDLSEGVLLCILLSGGRSVSKVEVLENA